MWILPRVTPIFLAVLLWLPGPAALSAQDSIQGLRERLRTALEEGLTSDALRLCDQLAALDTPQAATALIDVGLSYDTYDSWHVERSIGSLLQQSKNPAVLSMLCESAANHADYRVRSGLTSILAVRPEFEAYKSVLTNLYDRSPSVIRSAIDALTEKDDVDCVDHLIRALQYQEEQGLAKSQEACDLRRGLRWFTGADMERSADWRNFWEPRKAAFVRPDGVTRAAGRTSVGTRAPLYFGTRVETTRVLFLIDVSESMKIKDPLAKESKRRHTGVGQGADDTDDAGGIPDSRRRINRVQDELVRVVRELPEETTFSIMAFNHGLYMFESELVGASKENKARATRFVRSFEPVGETWTDRALQAAIEFPEISTIFLLSDGAPRKLNHPMDIEWLLEAVGAWNRHRRVRIYTIGFREAGSKLRRFLKELAERNHGTYSEVP